MKKIYGFLGAAAILTMAACTKDVDGLSGLQGEDADLYMTMTISAQTTRTETESQGKEVGKDRENEIKSGFLIIADYKTDKSGFQTISYATIAEGDIAGSSPTYATSFKMAREDLLNYIGDAESKEFYLFLIANPTDAIKGKYATKGIDIQNTFELTSDADTYWSKTESNFLMTSASLAKTTIQKSELAAGKHTTKADALNLGEVEVQRAMSRFDLATGTAHTEFSTTNTNSTLSDITIKFDAVALVNMAQKANLFKEVGMAKTTFDQEANGVTAGKWGYFHKETKTVYNDATGGDWTVTTEGNYVFAPDQTAYTYPLFTGGSGNNQTGGELLEHKSFFVNEGTYTLISAITEADNTYSHPNETTPAEPADIGYNIWRYCMPNANFDKSNQYNGNTTGILFRAEMTGTKITGTEPIYAYNNVILGTWAQLQSDYIDAEKISDTATDAEKEIFNMVRVRYAEAQAKAKEANSNTDVEEDAEHLDYYLVKQGFTIYKPENGKFYCYYIYWNRHNDNGNNSVMNAMEFATVRNNIYKISVNKITKLGHPGEPGGDPDPEDPGTPDEKNEFWGEITCKVLDWEVRINNVEF